MEQVKAVKNGGMPENWYAFYVWQRTGCYVDEALRKMGIRYNEHKKYRKYNKKLDELSKEELEELYNKCSIRELTIAFDTYYDKVYELLNKYGIKRKNLSEVQMSKIDKQKVENELKKVDELINKGSSIRNACRETEIRFNYYYYWKRRLKELEGLI